ncbi:MAG: Y-family DNA polymerase [Planctomycetota bacterium]|jgi:protein ImuB
MTIANVKALLHGATSSATDSGSGGVLCEPWRPDRDALALQRLGIWASRRFSPLVATDPPEGLLLDVTGCSRLFGGERPLRARVVAALDALGFHARAAIGPSVGCAWAMARYGAHAWCVHKGGEADALAPLPIEALRLDEGTVKALHEVAIDRIEHVLGLPREDLVERFGRPLLGRLDQALGRVGEPIVPLRPVVPLEVERLFDGPTKQLEAILLTGRDLVDMLAARLRARETGVTHLEVTLLRADLEPLVHTIALSHPSRDASHLWALLRQRLEDSHLGFGVEGMTFRAVREMRVSHEQVEHWSGQATDRADAEQALGRFIDTVSSRMGRDAVRRCQLVESHVPERAVVLRPWSHGRSKGAPEAQKNPAPGRPTVLFEESEPIEDDTSVEVHGCIGPERIAWEWWKQEEQGSTDHGTRDYYVLEDAEGRWMWVYRHLETGRWYVHGEWA